MAEEKKYSRRDFTKAAGGLVAAMTVGKACLPGETPPDGVGPVDGVPDSSEAIADNALRERVNDAVITKDSAVDFGVDAGVSDRAVDAGPVELGAEPVQEPLAETLSDAGAREVVVEPPPVDKGIPDLPAPDLQGRKYVTVDLKKHPDMKKIGWWIDVTLPSDSVNLFRRGQTEFAAVSVICTHKGCFVGWRSSTNRFVCPCHAAIFDRDGHVLGGPAPRDLRVYPTAYHPSADLVYIFLDR